MKWSRELAVKELMAEIRKLSQTQGVGKTFTTFLEILATSLGENLDPFFGKERGKQYNRVVKDMTQKELSAYARMCALMYFATKEEKVHDVLGNIFKQLNLSNEWSGQFFTPDTVSSLVASLALKPIYKKGCIIIDDHACGTGSMLLATVDALRKKGFDYYKHKYFFIGCDIDIRCVWMAYIQMCLYRVPAVIIHGNALTSEEWSYWVTPHALIPIQEMEAQTKAADQKESK